MTTINLNNEFSTTRLMTMEMPVIVNTPSSKVQSHLFLPPNPEGRGEGGLRTKGYFKQSYRETSEVSEKFAVPLVTIITVVFNGEKHLEQTIQSVISQTYNNVEYIIIDGGSTDGTVDIIRKYEEVIDYWVNEPDAGISDAMNKGISLATGILINHLHAGDKFAADTTLLSVVSSYNSEGWRWCFGNQLLRSPTDNAIVGCFCPPKFSQKLLHIVNTIPHPTVFSERALIEEVNGFDNNYKCAMDYHLWLRFTQLSKPKQFDYATAEFLLGGRSSDIKLALREEFRARKEVLMQSKLELLLSFAVVMMRYIKRQLRITTFVKNNPA
ncbi:MULTISPECIES: glycosyltransferase family 2 protein [unclassified Microcystis]|uniref:glycosyltransferase family 2 protein n=1 Tax=unclassified Microcystis TaxID=2643300 RepID=UPI001194E1E1|nr:MULTISPECIES: glycosyltransferase family 2 protein [unclassified Microcystis]MCA2928433.1 glycosyltransferase [Microcystis sp. M020S1]MCA2936309.1 glycosyltransferase [Microcystis sp. M015S1]MCA2619461.1 glycosyltransferase [Microcystis sp. M099S2]MCA2649266.1 glycosyltransferase [Microcystis sp. M065S2]MCA2678670.1 glycosyltransferase [Microcystis sp. M043S2]